MEEMKWSSSGLHGALAANNLGFGLAIWLKSVKLCGQLQRQEGMLACPN